MNFLERLRLRHRRSDVYSSPCYWNSKAHSFSGTSVSMWRNQALNEHYHQRQVSVIDTWIKEPKNKHILDVGCGTGRISRHLAAKGAFVTGIDFSEKAVEIARSTESNTGIHYKCGSIFDINESAFFDYVMCIGVLTVACRNAKDLSQALSGLFQALKPGGTIVLIEPIHEGFLHRVLNLRLKHFLNVMTDSGFAIQDRRELHFWPARIALCEIPWPSFLSGLGYYTGEAILNLIGGKMGDYKSILACRPLATNLDK